MQIPVEIAAYLAGSMDSDGTIGIKRSTYHQRIRKDARSPVYSERIALKHVTPQVPDLLHEWFGGSLRVERSPMPNGRPMHSWAATDKGAAIALSVMLPYLRVKHEQALNCLALRASKDRPRSETHARRSEPTISRNRWGEAAIHRLEVSQATLAEREDLYERARLLNRVGITQLEAQRTRSK